MQYKDFKDGIRLSCLGMGNMRLPVHDDENKTIDYELGQKIIDACYEAGVNYYDTAYVYHGGKSEVFLGEALKKYPRDSFYVADKFNYAANPDFKAQFAEQLQRLQMDRIDFYLMHAIMDSNIDNYLNCGCVEYFDQMKAEGKIKYFGFSFHGSVEALKRMVAVRKWDFVQIQFNYYDWYCNIMEDLYKILEDAGIPIMVMEPVHGGMLAKLDDDIKAILGADTDTEQAEWAMRWVLSHPQIQVVLSGMGSMAMAEGNIKTFTEYKALSAEEEALVEKTAKTMYSKIAVPCTVCRYCTPNCPMGLDIPEILRFYNEYKLSGPWRLNAMKGWASEKLPSACIGCGTCTGHCPQSFDIPKYMAELAEQLEKMGIK